MEKKVDEMENDEDEESQIKLEIDKTQSEIQECKKQYLEKENKIKLEDSNCRRYMDIIEEKKKELFEMEKSINLINEKLGASHVKKMFVDGLRKMKRKEFEIPINETLNFIKEAEKDESCLNWLKDYSAIENKKVLHTEKLKMMKNLGHFFQHAENLFEIDNLTFNNMQHKIEKIFTKSIGSIDSHHDKLTRTITIKVLLKNTITDEEFSEGNLNCDYKDSEVFQISIIDYDFMYRITKRFLVVEIKSLGERYFGLEDCDYMIVNEKFQIWPMDLPVYDLIFALNKEKNDIRPHSKFFHLDPSITSNLKFILISKDNYLIYTQRDFDRLVFVSKPSHILNSI